MFVVVVKIEMATNSVVVMDQLKIVVVVVVMVIMVAVIGEVLVVLSDGDNDMSDDKVIKIHAVVLLSN